jgi:tetratricopeptide (TPR) repeat protein
MRVIVAVTILGLASLANASAQQGAACHKGHIDAGYKMTPMPPPKLMQGIGTTSLKITTTSAEAQAYFSQGLALTHCFWDFEAYRAFKEAARLDPDAPMAYWGMVQSIDGYPAMADEKKASLDKIRKLMDRASEHEKLYLWAQQEQADGKPYLREIEAIVENYPDDLDAQAFLGLWTVHGYDEDGKPRIGQAEARSILEKLLLLHPDNAAANHYLIHVVEAGPHPEYALHAADALTKLAPASGHMVHMPGHIYFKMGDQARARESFLAAMRVEEEYMHREKVSVVDNWNYSHNISYLIASDAEAGRYKEALELAAKLDHLPAVTARAVASPRFALKEGSTTARLQIRFGKWKDVAEHPIVLGDETLAGEPARAYRDGVRAYAAGMDAAEKTDFAAASRESDRLDALQFRLKSADLDPKENGNSNGVLNLLESYSLDLRGNIECAKGHLEAGLALLRKAADVERKKVGYAEPPAYGKPEAESIGYAYLLDGQFDKARAGFEDELRIRPKSGHALYGIALSFEREGDRMRASEAYAKFLESWKNADADLPMVQHARGWR